MNNMSGADMIPKIIKMESKYHGIIGLTDELLNQKLSYRKIAERLRERYHCSICHESVRQYALHKQQALHIDCKSDCFYYVIKHIRR